MYPETRKALNPAASSDVALTGFHVDGPENLLVQLAGSKVRVSLTVGLGCRLWI